MRAEVATDESVRQSLLQIAETWEQMAGYEEKHPVLGGLYGSATLHFTLPMGRCSVSPLGRLERSLALLALGLRLGGRLPLGGRHLPKRPVEVFGAGVGLQLLRHLNEALRLFGVVGLGHGLCHDCYPITTRGPL